MNLTEEYIVRCDSAASLDESEKRDLIKEIVGVFSEDIPKIRAELDLYAPRAFFGAETAIKFDFDGDLRKLKAKLTRLLETQSMSKPASPKQIINVTQNNENSATISVSIDVTIDKIEKLSHDVLSDEDKEVLIGKITTLERDVKKGSSRKAIWAKAVSVIKWIADKGVEVGIAALPYIIQALQNAPQ